MMYQFNSYIFQEYKCELEKLAMDYVHSYKKDPCQLDEKEYGIICDHLAHPPLLYKDGEL